MILTESEIKQVLEKALTAFPNFTDWEYNNEVNQQYFGFSLWGQFVLDPEEIMSQCFFITLDTYKEKWGSHLTIGQQSYLWSSANVGDAHLLSTKDNDSFDDAITALKAEMLLLCNAFSVV
ncbi:MAG: hypothetical protein F6K21_00310 [Symploca sp. SIO2D2]|nr:hypothetical protein [Symploca sp. SIO2D2]NER21855.1 hypothetical protein [Symploca sp. SIO1C2]